MSQETAEWLNSQTLIGFTDARGKAWHYRTAFQGAEPNHYPGAIPVEDVRRRLFFWTPVEGTIETTLADGTRITDETRKAIVRPDTGAILGVFKQGFQIHDYNQWLIDNVEAILDDGLQVGSAGLLKGGAVAWVQVELPDTITTPEGVAFRPFVTAATSLDGSLASTYLRGAQLVVCDNTLSTATSDKTASRVKIKHSTNSLNRIGDVRQALDIIYKVSEDFQAKVAELCTVEVSESEWQAFLDAHVGLVDENASKRSVSLNESKRESLDSLYHHDNRVAPWTGTAFGVLQAVNTFTHHGGIVRGASRPERNALRVITGGIDTLDADTLKTLARVVGVQEVA